MEIGETVMAKKPAGSQLSMHFAAAHSFDQHLSAAELHSLKLAMPRKNDHVVDRTGTIGQAPPGLGWIFGTDRDGTSVHRNVYIDLAQPIFAISFFDRL